MHGIDAFADGSRSRSDGPRESARCAPYPHPTGGVSIARIRQDQTTGRAVGGEHLQVVVMTSLSRRRDRRGSPSGHRSGTRVVDGEGEAWGDAETSREGLNDLVFVRAGTRHYFVNTGPQPLRLITAYAPPHHAPGTVHQTKAEANAAEQAE